MLPPTSKWERVEEQLVPLGLWGRGAADFPWDLVPWVPLPCVEVAIAKPMFQSRFCYSFGVYFQETPSTTELRFLSGKLRGWVCDPAALGT